MSKRIVKSRPKKQVLWSDDIERLVLYADFMGFKSRIYDKSHNELKTELDVFHNKWTRAISSLLNGDYLRTAQFSDSILIVVNGVDEKMFNLLTKAAIRLMHTAMSMQIPIKGAIAQGEFTYDQEKQLYFGKPLVDAYLLHEEIKYYGIVVHNSAQKITKNYSSAANPYYESPIYIDRGKVNHYHLCWNLVNNSLSPCDITDQCYNWLEDISENVSGHPRLYIDRTKEIIKYDKDFVTHDENEEA